MNKTIGVDKNITVLDKINFILDTTDNKNCLVTPYKIISATIYFVSRDFTSNSVSEYEKSTFDDALLIEFEKIKAESCADPSEENIKKLNEIKIKLENSKYTSNFYFKEATPIKVFGSEEYPIWINPESVDASEREEIEKNNTLKPLIKNNQIIPGNFILEWDAYGNREGDYFICWHWKSTILSDLVSSHLMFSLLGEAKSNTSIPTHFTKPEKYETLMERYLPSVFKSMLSDNDLSPQVLQELNYSVAKGFTFLEDMANQIIDLFDSNVIQEQLLSLLSNLFDLQLRSNDSTLWRRQIKRAIPNYKKKGTKEGLKRALSDSGMKLLKLTNLWQVISKYTYQEMFKRIDGNISFTLARPIILNDNQPDEQNTEVYYRSSLSNVWEKLDSEYVSFTMSESNYVVNWIGNALPEDKKIDLEIGDEFRIIYQFREVPNLQEQNLENYIRILDLMDQREEFFSSGYDYKVDTTSISPEQLGKNFIRYNSSIQGNSTILYVNRSSISKNDIFDFFALISAGDMLGILNLDDSRNYQKFYITDSVDFSNDEYIKIPISLINSSGDDFNNNQNITIILNRLNPIYPPKNWNVRVIEQDDPLFDLIIPKRIPIQNPIIWGSIRTEFPYSENVYNMEEYNGSIRDSLNPCDIDKHFIEPCSDSPGSKISLDLEVEELSDDRMIESQKIIQDYVPIHALIHSINFIGSKTDLLKPPVESITALLHGSSEEILIAGEAQNIFNRSLKQIISPGNDLQNPILEDLSQPEIFYPLSKVRRTLLSNMTAKTETVKGIGSNKKIILYAPSLSTTNDLENSDNLNKLSSFDNYNINLNEDLNLLEILNSSNEGNYNIKSINKNSLELSGFISEFPLDKSQFEFRVSNQLYKQNSVIITKDYEFIFSLNSDISNMKIISQEDVDNNFSNDKCWKIKINESGFGCFDILKILPNNQFILKGPIPNEELINANWELLDGNSCGGILEGNEGTLKINKRAIVDLGDPIGLDDIRNIVNIGDYVYYDNNQYKIKSFINNEKFKFYIEDYILGDVGGVYIEIYRRIIENCVGNLDYQGLILTTEIDYEDLFKIQNGSNYSGIKTRTSDLKENYLILIDSNYYSILDIDRTTILLDGPYNEWKTTGTPVDFVIYQFINQPLNLEASYYPTLQAYNFDQVTRSNNEVISGEVETLLPTMTIAKKILNSKPSDNEIMELSKQLESINIKIEHSNGNIEEKQL